MARLFQIGVNQQRSLVGLGRLVVLVETPERVAHVVIVLGLEFAVLRGQRREIGLAGLSLAAHLEEGVAAVELKLRGARVIAQRVFVAAQRVFVLPGAVGSIGCFDAWILLGEEAEAEPRHGREGQQGAERHEESDTHSDPSRDPRATSWRPPPPQARPK